MNKYLKIREERFKLRLRGLKSIIEIIKNIKLHGILQSSLIPYWPSLQGRVDWCSYTAVDSGEVDLTEVRHHYNKSLEGISKAQQTELFTVFTKIELELARLLRTAVKKDEIDLGNMISLSLTLDYHPRDFGFMVTTSFLSSLKESFLLTGIQNINWKDPNEYIFIILYLFYC